MSAHHHRLRPTRQQFADDQRALDLTRDQRPPEVCASASSSASSLLCPAPSRNCTPAAAIAESLAEQDIDARAVASTSVVVGGGAPGVELPSAAVSLPGRYAAALCMAPNPVVDRIEGGRCLLDLRTVCPEDIPALIAAYAGGMAGRYRHERPGCVAAGWTVSIGR